ncbi:MAG: RsmE family RNA methyltransferase [SAR86 cluster bacterium]|jgi:16S rRNA (uracil1498-N3)-methyltransferase|nr:RsmE family RNA methyltransferase [SAR86 cluster bacterium]
MRKPRIFCPELSSSSYKSTNIKQIHHLAKVLRLKANDPVELFDGQGTIANGIIQEIEKDYINFHIDDISFMQNPYQKSYQAIIPYIKKENLIYSLQKLIELGVNSILIYKPDHLDQSLAKKDLSKLNLRLEEAMISACEQSGCNHVPTIHYFNELKECLHSIKITSDTEGLFVLDTIANRFIKDHEILSLNSITLITGPESGFSETERHMIKELGLQSLKIGHYVLRAETAPVVGLSKFHSLFGEY